MIIHYYLVNNYFNSLKGIIGGTNFDEMVKTVYMKHKTLTASA